MPKEVTFRKRDVKESNKNLNSSPEPKNAKKGKEKPKTNGILKKTSKEKGKAKTNHSILVWLTFIGLIIILSLAVNFLQLDGLNNFLQFYFGFRLPGGNAKKFQNDLDMYARLLEKEPLSIEYLMGKAKSLDMLAHIERSDPLLIKAVEAYEDIFNKAETNPNLVPVEILRECTDITINRLAFLGMNDKIIPTLLRASNITYDLKIQNRLGRAYIAASERAKAKEVFHEVLQKFPDSGYAQAHYGFTLKIVDKNLPEAIKYLKSGIESDEEGTVEKQLYLNLGDAYHRLGDDEKAYKVYDAGVAKGLFLSRYQRPVDSIQRLKAKPIWTLEETTYEPFYRNLASNWEKILAEALPLIDLDPTQGGFMQEEYLRNKGEWGQFMMFDVGVKNETNCKKTPFTCSLIEAFPPASTNRRGQTKFSLLKPGTTVFKHTGPSNCRLRAHLGLITPSGAALEVADTEGKHHIITWKAGKVVVFDDSFEHEVWHKGDSLRLILLVDTWHPEVTEEERLQMSMKNS